MCIYEYLGEFMPKNLNYLIIVESPNKVKTISQFLPNNYKVMASVGHISELSGV